MQDINTNEREMSNRKHRRTISRFEHTCSTSPLLPLLRIFIKNDPARSLGTATPTTSSLKSSWTHKSLTCSRKNNTSSTLACRGRTSTMSSLKNSTQHEPTSSLRPQSLQYLKYKFGTLVVTSLDHKNNSLTTRILEDEYCNGSLILYGRFV